MIDCDCPKDRYVIIKRRADYMDDLPRGIYCGICGKKIIDCEHKETDITFPDDRGETFGGIIETCLDCGEILNKEE